ncbi:MAG: hypothetical protein IPO60_14500 [Flavobacteriales bacterium]|nr:hypothetical protein [Flavobacteriales bacterium]
MLALVITEFRAARAPMALSGAIVFCLTGRYLLRPRWQCQAQGSAGFGTSLFDPVQLILGIPWPMYLLMRDLGHAPGQGGRTEGNGGTPFPSSASTVCLIFALGIFLLPAALLKGRRKLNFTLNDPEITLVIAVIFLGLLLEAQ